MKRSRDDGVCLHEVAWNSLCANCGAFMDSIAPLEPSEEVLSLQHAASSTGAQSSSEYVKAAFLSHDPMLSLKRTFADRMEKEAIRDLVKEKKGILILDLDHTLFHVTLKSVTRDSPGFETWSFDTEVSHTGRLMEGKTYWFNLDGASNVPFFIHLRPHLYEFLDSVSKLYDLYAYTQGTNEYARKILSGIDPDGKYFGLPPKLVAREIDPKTGAAGRKSVSRIFPNEEGLVLIVDDRDDVWDSATSASNLLKLIPFMFFMDGDRQKLFDLSPTSDSLFRPRTDDLLKPEIRDEQLVYLKSVLEDMHAELYFSLSQEGRSTPDIQQLSFPSVLSGRKTKLFENYLFIYSSRVSSRVYRLIEEYGGEVVHTESEKAAKSASGKTPVMLGVPGQSRRGRDPELVHPWFVLFSVSTFTVPADPTWFSISRIEQEGITCVWDCIPTTLTEAENVDEDDFLQDLLE